MGTDPERDQWSVVQSLGYSGWLGTAVWWWKTGARLPQALPWECFSASPGVLTVRGAQDDTHILLTVPVWGRGGSVPPGPQQFSRNWSCSALAGKAVPQRQGQAGEPPWWFRTVKGGPFHSALSLGGTSGGETCQDIPLYFFSYQSKCIVSQRNSVFILQATGFFLPFF